MAVLSKFVVAERKIFFHFRPELEAQRLAKMAAVSIINSNCIRARHLFLGSRSDRRQDKQWRYICGH